MTDETPQAGDYVYKGQTIRLWIVRKEVVRAQRGDEVLIIVQVDENIALRIGDQDVPLADILKHPTIGNVMGLRS